MNFNRPLLYLSLFLLTLIGCKTDEGKTTSTDNPTLDKSYINFTTKKYIDYQLKKSEENSSTMLEMKVMKSSDTFIKRILINGH